MSPYNNRIVFICNIDIAEYQILLGPVILIDICKAILLSK